MPVIARPHQLTPRDTKSLRRDLKQLADAIGPGCRFMAVSETLGRLGYVLAGQGQSHRPLRNLAEVETEFLQIARNPYCQLSDGDRIMFAVAAVDSRDNIRVILTLAKWCRFCQTQSKRPENDRPVKGRPGDRSGIGARLPHQKRISRHLHGESIPEANDLTSTRRV